MAKSKRFKIIPVTVSVAEYTRSGKKCSNTINYKFLVFDEGNAEELIEIRRAKIEKDLSERYEGIVAKARKGKAMFIDGFISALTEGEEETNNN